MEHIFTVTITGTEHHTWQGALRGGGEALPFRSEVELLLALDRLLPRARETADGLPGRPPGEGGRGQWRPT